MAINLRDSIVLVTSSDGEIGDFGTGFVVHEDGQASYVVTCAHVIRNVGGSEKVQAGHMTATVVASEEGIDVTVLRVEGFKELRPLSLCAFGERGKAFFTAGFQSYGKQAFLARLLQGILGEQGTMETRDQTYRTKTWDLGITGDNLLQPGYSGSPIVDAASGCVIGIVSNREGEGKRGLAISIEAVVHIWKGMPASMFALAQHNAVPVSIQQPFTVQERQKLVELLRKCPSMSNPEVRDIVVADLPEAIQSIMKRNRQLDVTDIRYIVNACLNYEGGLGTLIAVMKVYEPNSIPLRDVEAFLCEIQFRV